MKWKENWPLYIVLLLIIVGSFEVMNRPSENVLNRIAADTTSSKYWIGPDLSFDNSLTKEERAQIIYGQDLIANTSYYFGPKGTIAAITNGMNCQNCHLSAGNQPWGNNYGAVASTYPKFRDRSGTVESMSKRVNDCFERSLNGQAIDTNSKEMTAILTYMKWLGKEVPKGTKPKGTGIRELKYLSVAADPTKGRQAYAEKCQSCHGANGQGMLNEAGNAYTYPPLWGEHSYNSGAGLFRLSRLAGYIKDNMPYQQATHDNPSLSDEDAWNIAAFVNSQPRPSKDLSKDWPDISKKPIDHPFGPYADGFNEAQHKFGPFQPIADARKAQAKK